MMHDWAFGWGLGDGMFFGPLFMLSGVALVIALLILVIRWATNSSYSATARIRGPREILDERFAKGEIERNEYEQRRKALEG
jgi:putative membrane protein